MGRPWCLTSMYFAVLPIVRANICAEESTWLPNALPTGYFNPDGKTCEDLDNIQMLRPYSCSMSDRRWMGNMAYACCGESYDTKCKNFMRNNMCSPSSEFQPQAVFIYDSGIETTCVEVEGINNYGAKSCGAYANAMVLSALNTCIICVRTCVQTLVKTCV